jgi:hypothetical protein
MDADRAKRQENYGPIEKPGLPLPMIFDPRNRSDLPTLPGRQDSPVRERAHFFRKNNDKSGTPVYGFYITEEPAVPLEQSN